MLQPTKIFQNMKQMIIVNETLNLSKEKLAVQMAQASTGAYIEANRTDRKIWLQAGKPQIILKALNEDDLEDFLLKAERLKLPICRIKDTDLGASNADAITCLGIGPATNAQIDQLTNVFNLYCWVRQNVLNFGFRNDETGASRFKPTASYF